MTSKHPVLSLVLPIFNEEESVPLLVIELKKALEKLSQKYRLEVLFIDDGSSDQTVQQLTTQTVLPVKVISFSRNFGHQAALLAGLEASTGDVVISLDSDLQHPPSFIPELVRAYEAGHEIVFTKRDDDVTLSWFKKSTSRLFYKILNGFSDTKIQEAGSDFRLLSRRAVDSLLMLPEKRVFLRGMVSWIGFSSTTLTFTAQPRQRGSSKYNLYRMLRLAIFGVSSFSTAPLYVAAFMGFIFSWATVLYGAYVLYIRFVERSSVAGWSSVIFVLLGMGSILSFLLAILGIYLAAVYDEVKQRPIYILAGTKETTSHRS